MSVHNVTSYIEDKTLQAIMKKYNLDKFIFCYSSGLNSFGIRTIPKLQTETRETLLKYLINKTNINNANINYLTSLPQITGKPRQRTN